ADAAMMMQLGADGVFVGSGIFKSGDPAARAAAIVKATTFHDDPDVIAKASRGLGEPMVGLNLDTLPSQQRYEGSGWYRSALPSSGASTLAVSVRSARTASGPAASSSAAVNCPVATPTARAPVASAAAMSSGVSPTSTVASPPKSPWWATAARVLASGTSSALTSCSFPYAPIARSR